MSNHYPDNPKRVAGIVVGGHDGDPDPQQTSNMRVMMPSLHGPDVNTEDMAFSPMTNAPTNAGQQSFMGALDPGSLVYMLKTLGENGGIILGQANDLYGKDNGSGSGSGGGGKDLLQGEQYQKAINTELNVFVPPEIKEKDQSDGVRVKTPKEKGKKHKHALTQGMPTHAALFPMSGYRLPQIKKVPTAKKAYQDIMNNDMMGKLPGMVGSLSGMMKGLMGGMGGSGGGAGGAGGGGSQSGGTGASSGTGNSNSSFSVSFFDPSKTVTTDINEVTNKESTNTAYGVVVSTTTTTATIKETTQEVEETHYDIHDPTSYKFGRSYLRYQAVHGSNRGKLPSRLKMDNTRVETSNVYSDSIVNEANSYYKTVTTTEKTIKTSNTVFENFTGTYKDYYGANSNITRMDIIYDNVDPQVAVALDNLSVLLQGDAGGDSMSMTAGRVHEETWLDNATDLFCQCQSVTDIMSALHRIVSDESLFGHEKLENVVLEVETAEGLANTILCANGDIFTVYSANQLAEMANTQNNMISWEQSPSGTGMNANTGNAKAEYANTKASGAGSGGGSGGGGGGGGGGGMMGALGQLGNMFGKSAPIMQNMMKRMEKEHEQDAKKLHKKVNQESDAKNMWSHVEKTHEGGNPVAYDLFKMISGGGMS